MFLHLGGDVTVLQKDIVGIFDLESTKNPVTKEFLEIAKNENSLIRIMEKQPSKSFIIAGGNVYYSPISSNTLQRRTFNI